MADYLLKQAQDLFEGQIDFEGQRFAELLTTLLLAGTGLLAFILGWAQQNIFTTLWVGIGGTALTFFFVVPPFPIYTETPEKWLRSGSGIAGAGIEVDGEKIN